MWNDLPPPLAAAIEEVRALAQQRAWQLPDAATLAEARRLLALVSAGWPPPQVQVEPDGQVSLTWEAGPRGWLTFTVAGRGTLTHSAVIAGDDYGQEEPFGDSLPAWAAEVLRRLWDRPLQ
ncbi:hypothetical protein [Caldimonas thermodepolymerans]|uniref:Uncharacterized protein n=1 Tax=Caldimonas thermodepolymerans TaxID=215580 RepID=A0AA46DBU2_9BURK|nr:hypothetical protein [Caldimonas thermodepolymerans]TCP05784.1 hypothetical protein EV676_10817 [Caldimonas thermodepolymerans]UZG48273.1 hypothetical protein ONS87_01270 [Caldimonas thermodepolymerans]